MNRKDQRRPIIDPLLLALKSRRVMVALCTLVLAILISALPALAHVQSELLVLLVTLGLALIGGYSVEDAASAARTEPTAMPPQPDITPLVKEALVALLDEMHRRE
jgi:hypothetical protein